MTTKKDTPMLSTHPVFLAKTGPPFTLPEEPIDRYEARWYSVDAHLFTITECRAVYHVKSTWEAVMDGVDSRGAPPQTGADFVDQWQLFQAGRFTGRAIGWGWSSDKYDWTNDYPTRQAARGALRKLLFQAIESRQAELTDLHKKLGALDDEAWQEWERAHPEDA
jgi:hypothetical protein